VSLQRYAAPASLDEAVALLAAEAHAFALAGGTDLLVQMRSGAKQPTTIVDLKNLPGITGVEHDEESVRIGACACCAALAEVPLLRQWWPGLMDAAGLIGSSQIQGRASIGGNLCNGSPAADSVPALIVNGAVALVAGPDGQRAVPVAEFCRGPGETALGDGEFLFALELRRPASRSSDAYLRFTPRTEMDIAVAGVAVALTLDEERVCTEARVAIGAVAPTARLVPEAAAAIVGTRLEASALERCTQAVRSAARPIDDRRGTAAFRRHVVGVLARRAVIAAAARID
jgi:carbon-monoxide dehydrogenase medium subunit